MKRLSPKPFRIVVGGILLAVMAGLFALDWRCDSRAALSSVAVVLGLGGFIEYAKLTGLGRRAEGGGRGLAALGGLATAYFLALAVWEGASGSALPAELLAAGLAGLLLGGFLSLFFRADFTSGLPPLLATLLGVVLFGWLFSYTLRIYWLGDREAALVRGVVVVLGIKGTDIAAYLVGSAIGRHRFLKVSPAKTLEGCAGALIFGGAWFAGAAYLFPAYFFAWPLGILFGIILAVTSALGDLAESLIKRFYRVKDSSSLLPEFGGVLDMIDSLVFSGFVFWCLLQLAAGALWK